MARPEEVRSVLLDSSCWLGIISREAYYEPLRSLLTAVDRGAVTLVVTTVTLVEVRPAHDRGDATIRDKVLSLFESESARLIDVSTAVARRAAALAEEFGMKNLDAIHLATGILAEVDVVFARDRTWPFGRTVDRVYVSEPYDIDWNKLAFEVDG